MKEKITMPFSEKVILIVVLCIVISAMYSVVNVKDPREKKCIDGTLYRLTNQGYALAYNQKCKALPVEGTSH